MDTQKFELISKILRYYIISISSKAGSGHPTSSLSATDLLSVLYFGFLKYDFDHLDNRYNDRLIFSKGHASPLLYSLYKVAGKATQDEIMQYRTLNSPLQGHPTPQTPYVDVATGSLGMGLSFGLGMAMANKQDGIENKTYVLLGDGEMAEGNVWEALQVASYYKVNNLIAILYINRLEETGETMLGHNIDAYQQRISAFGWETIAIDGHNHTQIYEALQSAHNNEKPTMILAKTIKGKGVSFLEDKENRHGKALKGEDEVNALKELAITEEQKQQVFEVAKPTEYEKIASDANAYAQLSMEKSLAEFVNSTEPVATRKAYGTALSEMIAHSKNMIVVDGDLSDSTFSGLTQAIKPTQFFNMFIAEQNMIAAGTGMTKMGKTVFASTFAAFLTRAYDQIRMSSLSESNIKITGSHVGVSIGEDGASQMGLEDIAMMRAVLNSTILYPSDAVSTVKLVQQIPGLPNITYLRTTRKPTAVIYSTTDSFPIGGSKTLHKSDNDVCLVVAAGVTLHEALKAYEELAEEGIHIRVIDCYSIKPIDADTLQKSASECNNTVITVEDHYLQGGLGDAVLEALALHPSKVTKLGIKERPHSGKPDELINRFGISSATIIETVKAIFK